MLFQVDIRLVSASGKQVQRVLPAMSCYMLPHRLVRSKCVRSKSVSIAAAKQHEQVPQLCVDSCVLLEL